jgi:hypothetical protein
LKEAKKDLLTALKLDPSHPNASKYLDAVYAKDVKIEYANSFYNILSLSLSNTLSYIVQPSLKLSSLVPPPPQTSAVKSLKPAKSDATIYSQVVSDEHVCKLLCK